MNFVDWVGESAVTCTITVQKEKKKVFSPLQTRCPNSQGSTLTFFLVAVESNGSDVHRYVGEEGAMKGCNFSIFPKQRKAPQERMTRASLVTAPGNAVTEHGS